MPAKIEKKIEKSRYIFKYACYVPLGRSTKKSGVLKYFKEIPVFVSC